MRLFTFVSVLFASPFLHAQLGEQVDRLTPVDGGDRHNFGASIAVADGLVAVGAPGYDDGAGAVYLFDQTTGIQVARLQPQLAGDEGLIGFGSAVSMNADFLVASAEGESSTVRILSFDRATGQQTNSFTLGTAGILDTVRLEAAPNNLLAVGGLFGFDLGPFGGGSLWAVGIFDLETGTEVEVFDVPVEPNVETPVAVDITIGVLSTSVMAVGVCGESTDAGTQTGRAYLVIPGTGQILHELEADDPKNFDWFGWDVAIEGETLVVGAPRADDQGLQSGKAYIFNARTGNQEHILLASDGSDDDGFGASVAIAENPDSAVFPGKTIIIGAPRVDRIGAAYLFDAETGEELAKLTPDTASGNARFGEAVALTNDRAFTGAPQDDAPGEKSGAVHVFGAKNPLQVNLLHRFDIPNDPQELPVPVALDISDQYIVIGEKTHGVYRFENREPYSLHSRVEVEETESLRDTELTGNQNLVILPFAIRNDLLLDNGIVEEDFEIVYTPGSDPWDEGTLIGDKLITLDIPAGYIRIDNNATFPGVFGEEGSLLTMAASEKYLAVTRTSGSSRFVDVYSLEEGERLSTLEGDFNNPNRFHSTQFGSKIVISGENIFVSAPREPFSEDVDQNAGAVYRFDAASGIRLRKYLSPDRDEAQRFGSDIDVFGDTLLVGNTGYSGSSNLPGIAYVIDVPSATIIQTIYPPAEVRRFGRRVALTYDKALISGTTEEFDEILVWLYAIPADDAYSTWSGENTTADNPGDPDPEPEPEPDRDPNADPNEDGVSNLMAYVIGAEDLEKDARELLPKGSIDPEDGALTYTYQTADRAEDINKETLFSMDGQTWYAMEDFAESASVTLEVRTLDNARGFGIDETTIKIPPGDLKALFMRLKVDPQ
jgi:hypothetical protein